MESSALLGTGNTVNVSVIAATIGGEPSRWSKAYTQGSCEKQSWENTERLHRLSGNSECGCSSTEWVAGGREDAGRALGVTERSLHLVQRAVEAPGLWGVAVCVQMWGRAYTGRLPAAQGPPLPQSICGIDSTDHLLHHSETSGFQTVSPRSTRLPHVSFSLHASSGFCRPWKPQAVPSTFVCADDNPRRPLFKPPPHDTCYGLESVSPLSSTAVMRMSLAQH